MKGKTILIVAAITLSLGAIFSCSNKKDEKVTVFETTESKDSAGIVIRNNIQVKGTGGLAVKQAYMMRSNGSLVNDSNNVKVGEVIELRMLVDGWKGQNGKIALGGSENISTDNNQVALDVKDMFAGQPSIPLDKANIIRIQATVTKADQNFNYYLTKFKVWNKMDSTQTLVGEYKLYNK